uniref:Uncharacterized protein n=1 Tax=Setaria viridis TaxID=4556 RepID=A0A4U6WRR3_SETVI|nr:hypothetical protein SEVIR_1G338932v2 [Setaria viridis]
MVELPSLESRQYMDPIHVSTTSAAVTLSW